MKPLRFFCEAATHALHSAWHLSHASHFLLILTVSGCVVAGLHLEEHTLIALPFVALVCVFFFGVFWHAYALYRKEHKALAAAEATIADLTRRLAAPGPDTEQRRHKEIGVRLAALHSEGLALRRAICAADDSVPPADCRKQSDEWTAAVTGYVAEHISPAKAQFVGAVASVMAMCISGMKSNQTRGPKTDIVLYLDVRLDRLSEIMKAY